MLKSKFDKDPSKFCAQKIFTDRKVPSQVLADNLLEINDIVMVGLNSLFKDIDNYTESKMSKFSNIPGLF